MVIGRFPVLFGKYILLDRVNAGGMAEVFRAKVTGAESFERLVAIKCMLPQLLGDELFIRMFIDEAKLAAQLSHANIVQIYELGRLGERLYIAMELIQGRDLRHIIRSAKAIGMAVPPGFAAYVVSKAALGLDFAHRKAGVDGTPLNLVHRDVSPQNILVSYDGEVKVVDFGIAKAEARATETQAGVLKGKFAYMAPEQVMGEKTDQRADIFALGSVLFETLTGDRLFTGDSDMALLENVRAARLPQLDAVLPPNTQELQRILERALSRRPQDRYTYAAEFGDELEHFLIEDRAIFGAKRAAQLMQVLFASEIAEQAVKAREYAEVTAQSCVESLGRVVEGTDEPGQIITFPPVASPFANLPGMGDETHTPARVALGAAPHGFEATEVQKAAHRAPPPPLPSDTWLYNMGGDAYPSPVRSKRAPKRARALTVPDLDASEETAERSEARAEASVPQRASPRPGAHAHTTALVGQELLALRPSGTVLRRLMGTVVATTLVLIVMVLMTLVLAPKATQLPALPAPMQRFVSAGLARLPPAWATYLNPPPPLAAPGVMARPLPMASNIDLEDEPQAASWLHLKAALGEHGRVFIDNREVGALPLAPQRLSVGPHEVKIVGANGAHRLMRVEVAEGHTKKMPQVVALPRRAK